MPPPRRRLLNAASAATTLLALGAFASEADAAAVITQPCVRDIGAQQTFPISGSGFTPGGSVSISYVSAANPTPTSLTSVQADTAGNIATLTYPAAFKAFDTTLQSYTLIATDTTNAAIPPATTPFQQVRFGYDQKPTVKRPKVKTHHIASGFESGKIVYLHLRFGGKTQRTVSLGVAKGPCGIATKKLPQLPAKARVGTWKFYVDESKTFSLKTRPQARASLRVFRTFH